MFFFLVVLGICGLLDSVDPKAYFLCSYRLFFLLGFPCNRFTHAQLSRTEHTLFNLCGWTRLLCFGCLLFELDTAFTWLLVIRIAAWLTFPFCLLYFLFDYTFFAPPNNRDNLLLLLISGTFWWNFRHFYMFPERFVGFFTVWRLCCSTSASFTGVSSISSCYSEVSVGGDLHLDVDTSINLTSRKSL